MGDKPATADDFQIVEETRFCLYRKTCMREPISVSKSREDAQKNMDWCINDSHPWYDRIKK
jgi:hypothetical protein